MRAAYPWAGEALCATVGSDFWFPEKGESPKPAKTICRRCPVQTQCLEEALAMPTRVDGVWGGTTENERRKLRRMS